MQEFLLKKMIENLLETAIFSQHVNQNFARKVADLADEASKMQQNLKNEPIRKAAEAELKDKINE